MGDEGQSRGVLPAHARIRHDGLISNHITARLPENANHFLVNPLGPLYNQMTASCLIKLDIDGNVLLNPNRELKHSPSGYVIHGRSTLRGMTSTA